MNVIKKTAFIVLFVIFLFIFLMFLEIAGANPFDSSFVTIGGLLVLVFVGISDINFVTL